LQAAFWTPTVQVVFHQDIAGGLQNELAIHCRRGVFKNHILKLQGEGSIDRIGQGVNMAGGTEVQVIPEKGDAIGRRGTARQHLVGRSIATKRTEGDKSIRRDIKLRIGVGKKREGKANVDGPGNAFVRSGFGRSQRSEIRGNILAESRNILPSERRPAGLG
jgi:hypothetical protein